MLNQKKNKRALRREVKRLREEFMSEYEAVAVFVMDADDAASAKDYPRLTDRLQTLVEAFVSYHDEAATCLARLRQITNYGTK